ncbi:hypothetical protein MLOOGBEN_13505 [Bacillus sp. EB106-08-02-XG196]|uniref:hypothetical protein n=1 Tax=Bacillus sp. EB106-08-02-XG196 TaxID=2737049 RepID=UPI0015C4AA78|nr:hypothetical protein [Bacillus sp. EB106-08-02-XG196]NWQ41712.1 hypothetical protein [Bacillus sp. EB106-08-02-XG196]
MYFERQKAMNLAENIKEFIEFIHRQKNKNSFRINSDKLYQVNLWIEDFKFQILADELIRINQFDWDGKYTFYLVDRLQQGITIIDEYVKNNYHDLFILTARLYTLKNLSTAFGKMA